MTEQAGLSLDDAFIHDAFVRGVKLARGCLEIAVEHPADQPGFHRITKYLTFLQGTVVFEGVSATDSTVQTSHSWIRRRPIMSHCVDDLVRVWQSEDGGGHGWGFAEVAPLEAGAFLLRLHEQGDFFVRAEACWVRIDVPYSGV